MPDPSNTNDDWADLAREFDLDKPSAPPPADMVERVIAEEAVEPHHGTDTRVEDAAIAEGETEAEGAEDEFEDAEEGTGEATADGEQPGTGRKRRRRRRRRRKGGAAPAEGTAVSVDDAESDSATSEADEEPLAEPFAESGDYADDENAEDAEPIPLADDEEDTASDVLRELIATWNVPSWDEIVGGLYRPDR